MTQSANTAQALDRFIDRVLEHQLQQAGRLPLIAFDTEWRSDCYQSEAAAGAPTRWCPVRQADISDLFERIGLALEQPIHPDIVTFYSRYWSDPLPALHQSDRLTLLQLWNPEDGERLRSNLLGHALMKTRQKQPLTLFFATTEPDDMFISLNNSDGSIWLEAPGKKPLRKIADSLTPFLDTLQPDTIQDQE
ncbi:SecY-interacting protein [Marinobacterium sedimentorum]|uniref:SecY-interacting protein n=1 Tax=Marinobacterium sedimentorum TaxID=2927804 RepID=UPI0020C62F41|nr:SecY-interacting protein [Marinobacterium sedimentorum]MCP8687865.1 SecY-interacting protein [Marinobacterium sedimentorum]